jgi:hypothetical protein
MAVNTHLKKRSKLGVKRDLPPWVASPSGGDRGVIFAIALNAFWEGSLLSQKNEKICTGNPRHFRAFIITIP